MNEENIKFLLAIWGAVLSTLLAIIKVFQDNKDSQIKIFIDCQEKAIDDGIFLVAFIANTWKRPVTLVELNIGLGSFENQKIIHSIHLNPMIKLNESESHILTLQKEELLKINETLSDRDFLFSRLIVNLKLTSGKTIREIINLNPKILKKSINPKYDQFLIVAEFFNRDIVSYYNDLFTKNMIYGRK